MLPVYANSISSRKENIGVVFLVWLVIVISASVLHSYWRDEVVALSIAIGGDSVLGMLANLHEGHPGLWYVLLRTVYSFFPVPEILPVISVVISASAMALMLYLSPFSLPFMTAILLTRFGFYEYTVMTRNNGISMLLLFLIAHFYEDHKKKGVLLGTLLLLLANCNAVSMLLVCAFLVFWILDIYFGRYPNLSLVERNFLIRTYACNLVIAIIGIAACLWIIIPDNARAETAGSNYITILTTLVSKIMAPDETLHEIARPHWLGHFQDAGPKILKPLPIIILLGSLLGLIRRPAALIGALAAMVAIIAFFGLVLGGGYRHHALLIAFLLSLYWIVGKQQNLGHVSFSLRLISQAGAALFVVLIVAQIPDGVKFLYGDLTGEAPNSRSRDVALFIKDNPEYKNAIITSDSDFMLQAFPFYLSNPLYLAHQEAYMVKGVPPFNHETRGELTLKDLLQTARVLEAKEKVPVIILLCERSGALTSAQIGPEGYKTHWHLNVTAEQLREFLDATTLLKSFGPTLGDENYDMYTLKKSPG